MYRAVLRDYRYHLKEKLVMLKKQWWSWWPVMYCCFLMPFSLNKTRPYIVGVLGVTLPLCITLLMTVMYGGQISKTLYLCPMSVEDRKRYIEVGIRLRVIITMVTFTVLNVILMLFNVMDIYMFVTKFFSMLLFAISTNIYCPVENINSTNSSLTFVKARGKVEIYRISSLILGMFCLLILSCFEGNEKMWELILVAVLLLAQLVICIMMVVKFYGLIVDRVSYYEKK